jgi:hypothetical protein
VEAGAIHRGDRIDLEAADSVQQPTTDDAATDAL